MTAALLPLPRFVAYSASTGDPLAGGFLYPLDASTMAPKATWQDAAQTIPNTHPIVLDSSGSCILYGNGTYFLQTTDALGNVIAGYCGISEDQADAASALVLTQLANDTTDPSGACLIGYYHNVTGFTGRMVCERLFDRLSVLDFGADSTGGTDATAHFQAGINYLQSVGGGTLWVPRGTYLIAGTLNITNNGVILRGESQQGCTLNFSSATADGIKIGFQTPVVYDAGVHDLTLRGTGSNITGHVINAQNFAFSTFSGLAIGGFLMPILVDTLNDILIERCTIQVDVVGGTPSITAAIAWTSPATSAGTSNGLTIRSVDMDGHANTMIGLMVDGSCHTLRIDNVGLLNFQDGFVIRSSSGSASYYPTFAYINDLEVDGNRRTCVTIAAGRDFYFVNCDFFNAGIGTDVVVIDADSAASVTAGITFTNCRIAGGLQSGVVCEAKQVDFIACYIGDNSLAGVGTFPAIHLNFNGTVSAQDINIIGCKFLEYGDFAWQNYGVTCDSGVTHVNIVGCNFVGCVTGGILDASGGNGNVTWANCVDKTGTPLPIRVPVVPGDPPDLYDGEMWVIGPTGTPRIRLSGVTRTITVV